MTTTAIGGVSRARERALEEDSSRVAHAGLRTAPAEIARGAISAKIDADLAAFVGSVLEPKPTPENDEILYVGINEYSANTEVRALAQTGVRVHRVEVAPPDVSDVSAFVGTLGLPPAVASAVGRVLEEAAPSERGRLAEIAKVWSAAERGGTCPSRLLLSGHSSDGNEVYGGFGSLRLDDVRKLAHAMPRAASRIEDVHVSACSTAANAASSGAWRAAFPNAKSIWCYNGSAPSPATHHLLAWAQMTRGRRELPRLGPDLARANVAIWTSSRGYENDGVPLPVLAGHVRRARERFDQWMCGTLVASPHGGRAERDFRALTDYANRRGVTDADKARATREAACLVRLRYYGNVRSEFAKRDAKQIDAGFRALGLAVPDFAALSRKDALAAIARFESEVARRSPPPAACLVLAPLLGGLASLDPAIIPNRWCQ